MRRHHPFPHRKQRKVSFADEDGAQLEHVQEIRAASATNSSFASHSSDSEAAGGSRPPIRADLSASISDVDDDDDMMDAARDPVHDRVVDDEVAHSNDPIDKTVNDAEDVVNNDEDEDLDEWGFQKDLAAEIDRRVLASKSTSSGSMSAAGGPSTAATPPATFLEPAPAGPIPTGSSKPGPPRSNPPAPLTAGNPRQWSSQQVAAWLSDIGMGQHSPAFVHHGVNGAALLAADESCLQVPR